MAENNKFLIKKKQEQPIDIAKCLHLVQKNHGKPVSSQLAEILKLTFGKGKLTPQEYYYYRLYENRLTFPEKLQFLGRRIQTKIIRKCNPSLLWWGVAHDKLLSYALLHGFDFPTPETYAIYHKFRTFRSIPLLKNSDELADFLRNKITYPFFAKPVTGMHSVGAVSVQKFDTTDDMLILSGGDRIGIKEFIDEIASYQKEGYIFQELLKPHPLLQQVCGPAISTVRVIVMVTENGPEVFRTLWKIAAQGNIADNFWWPGNLLAAVDVENGCVERVIQGIGPDQIELEAHPDTSKALKGFTLPEWSKVVELCLKAATAFAGLRLQAWDIAICASGPVAVEINIGGDFNLPQLISGKGLMEPRFQKFITDVRRL